ncbi:hypothetical protein F8M41_003350 [Gigaspora margarita]|uniref:Uncharacterized protein n=1 Tax=Gigaspora margarita TaxID=4874 RepID=A0A8H3XEE0_GIGMA|nr:hypothetical protein F8M41_003350 [Gigaspora margarita]
MTEEESIINDIINSDTSDCSDNEVTTTREQKRLNEILSELSEPIVVEESVSDSSSSQETIALLPDLF